MLRRQYLYPSQAGPEAGLGSAEGRPVRPKAVPSRCLWPEAGPAESDAWTQGVRCVRQGQNILWGCFPLFIECLFLYFLNYSLRVLYVLVFLCLPHVSSYFWYVCVCVACSHFFRILRIFGVCSIFQKFAFGRRVPAQKRVARYVYRDYSVLRLRHRTSRRTG